MMKIMKWEKKAIKTLANTFELAERDKQPDVHLALQLISK